MMEKRGTSILEMKLPAKRRSGEPKRSFRNVGKENTRAVAVIEGGTGNGKK